MQIVCKQLGLLYEDIFYEPLQFVNDSDSEA
jgi:hypothetical protein